MFKKVTVAGSGVLGSQIAMQTAYHGFTVRIYDITDDAIAESKKRLDVLRANFKKDLRAEDVQLDETFARISFHTDLAEAAPAHTVFASNSSTLLPSQFAKDIGMHDRAADLQRAAGLYFEFIARAIAERCAKLARQ